MPMLLVFPIRAIDDRVQADAFDGNPRTARGSYLDSHFPDPSRPSGPEVAGLGHEDRPPVAIIDLLEQAAEGYHSRIARGVLPAQPRAALLPLIRVIIIHAHD